MQVSQHRIAFLISRILGPFPLLLLLWFTTAFKSGIGFWKALWVYPLILFVGLGIPFLFSSYLMMTGRIKDFDWKNLKDRFILVPVILVCWPVALVLTRELTNQTIYHLAQLGGLIVAAELIIMTVFKRKISSHVIASSAVFWGINFLTHFKFWWLFFLLIPIIWSRLILGIHTSKQLLAGLILTNGLIILAVVLFGWPKVP